MKHYLGLVVALFITFPLFTACVSDSDEGEETVNVYINESSIIGTWQTISDGTIGTYSDSQLQYTQLLSDYTLRRASSNYGTIATLTGTWLLSGNSLTLYFADGTTYIYSVTGLQGTYMYLYLTSVSNSNATTTSNLSSSYCKVSDSLIESYFE